MATINGWMTRLFDVCFTPLDRAPSWLSLVLFSMIAAAAGLIVYKYTSNQSAIKRTKDRIKASILAIKLFRDELGVIATSLIRVSGGALRLLGYALVPLIVLIVPFVLVTAQLAMRFQWRPLHVGESAVLSVTLADGHDPMIEPAVLETGPGVELETPALRIPSERRVLWRLRANAAGDHPLKIKTADRVEEKTLTAGDGLGRVSPLRSRGSFWDEIFYPTEPAPSADSPVMSIRIDYPPRETWFAGSDWWLLWLVGLSFVFAFLLKPIIRVEF